MLNTIALTVINKDLMFNISNSPKIPLHQQYQAYIRLQYKLNSFPDNI